MQRLAGAQGRVLSDREAHWWAVHISKLIHYARRRAIRVAAEVLVAEYLEILEQPLTSDNRWRAKQPRQALETFLHGIENWHWVEQNGQLSPKFRLKTAAADHRAEPPPEGISPNGVARNRTPR